MTYPRGLLYNLSRRIPSILKAYDSTVYESFRVSIVSSVGMRSCVPIDSPQKGDADRLGECIMMDLHPFSASLSIPPLVDAFSTRMKSLQSRNKRPIGMQQDRCLSIPDKDILMANRKTSKPAPSGELPDPMSKTPACTSSSPLLRDTQWPGTWRVAEVMDSMHREMATEPQGDMQ